MNPHPNGYSPEQIARVQRWCGHQANLRHINLAVSNRRFWRYFNDPLEMHRAAPFLEGVRSTLSAGPRLVFLNALAQFCSGNPDPIENMARAKPAPASRKQAA